MTKRSDIMFILRFITLASALIPLADATSIKMDFLPLTDLRVDPIIAPNCLSDHVHTFYGASNVYPDLTYSDLLATTANSGNVDENKSLYWHPTVYRYDRDTGIYSKDEIWFSTAYYIWTTGAARAFPAGFRMIAGLPGQTGAQASAECVGESRCERDNCDSDNSFFPTKACWELEVSMRFPTCWDGVNLDSDDHTSHVSYDLDGGTFDGDCPPTHPVRLPQIQLFFRIKEYDGGHHTFSHGDEGGYHADYVSGWDEQVLQDVLDTCENYSEAAMPDAWCEDFLTFKDAPKRTGDEDIVEKLQAFQPNPPLSTSDITTEIIDGIDTLPRGTCTGNCISCQENPNPNPTLPPASSPTQTFSPTPDSAPVDTLMHIQNIGVKLVQRNQKYFAKINLSIHDEFNTLVPGVTISLNYTLRNKNKTKTKKTNNEGKAVIKTGKIPLGTSTDVSVKNIVKEGYEYDDSENKVVDDCPVLSSGCPIVPLVKE